MTEVTVEVGESGETKRTEKRRPAVRRRSFICLLFITLFSKSSLFSLIGFVAGVFFASLFISMLLFLEKFEVWTCAYMSVVLAGISGFGMGISTTVRADAAVMLPSFCSGRGRTLVALVLASILISGPIANSLHNIELASASFHCSSQLVANQTRALLQKATSPFSGVLENLKLLSQNAHDTAKRIENLIDALTESVRKIDQTLRNILLFLVDIGDICNEELGAPYRTCRKLFIKAKTDCVDLLKDFKLLCDIVDGFMPLCELARIGELFCILPSYVGEQLKKRVAVPVVSAFEQLKQEFVFNLSASVTYGLDANSSQSLEEVTHQILKEVTSEMSLLEMLIQPLDYIALLILPWTYFTAARYRRRYLKDLDYDNIYISRSFKKFDKHVKSMGGVAILPVTKREAQIYISPFSCRMSNQEINSTMRKLFSAMVKLLVVVAMLGLDFLIFWILDQIKHETLSDIIVRAPVHVHAEVNGSGYAADIYRDLFHSFQVFQSKNMTVFSRECLVQPRHPNNTTSITIGILLGVFLLLSLFEGFIQRSKRAMCSWLHPQREQERLSHLRKKIMKQRKCTKRARITAFFRKSALISRDMGWLQALLVHIPGVSRLWKLMSRRKTSCLSCSKNLSSESAVHCNTSTCSTVYCGECFLRWKNSCMACGQPLEDGSDVSDPELGSEPEDQ